MHSVSAELCAQWRNHVREKTTEFVQGIKRTKVSGEASMQNSRQRRALVGTRRAGHRVGTSTLLGDPCSAAASLDPANRSTGGFYQLFSGRPNSVPDPFELFHRLPAVTVRTPTGQKGNNRSIAYLLSNFTRSISCSKPCPAPSAHLLFFQ